MQKEDFRFRLNIQVAIMLGIVMAALALPMLAVVLAFKGFFPPKPEPRPQPGEDEALRQALIQVADKALPPARLEAETVAISRSTPDLTGERQAIEEDAKSFGGVAVTMEQTGESCRLVAQIPANSATEFLSKWGESDHDAAPKGKLQGTSSVFEITLRKSSP